MERITIDNKVIDLTPAARADVLQLLDRYLDRKDAQTSQSLEQQFREAATLHRDQPRKFGTVFREALATAKDEATAESLLRNGVLFNVLLDRLAYPTQKPTDAAIEGWPKDRYLPDGFSFLSYDDDINRPHTDATHGEKIRIDKLELIKGFPETEFQALAKKITALIKTLPLDANGKRRINSLDTVRELYQLISDFIQKIFTTQQPTADVKPLATHSVLLNEFVKNPAHAVCRHKEFVAQVLLQLFG